MQGFHNQTCSTTYWEKGSWQVFKQVRGKLTQTMLSKAFLEELKSKDRQKINKWNRTRITFSHTDKKVRHVMSHQPALAVVTCSFKKFSARRIIESIQTLILISFGANFFTSLSSLSPKPVKKEKLKLMMCCSSKFSLHLIPCFNFEPQNTQTQIFPSGLLGYLCLQHQCIIQ